MAYMLTIEGHNSNVVEQWIDTGAVVRVSGIKATGNISFLFETYSCGNIPVDATVYGISVDDSSEAEYEAPIPDEIMENSEDITLRVVDDGKIGVLYKGYIIVLKCEKPSGYTPSGSGGSSGGSSGSGSCSCTTIETEDLLDYLNIQSSASAVSTVATKDLLEYLDIDGYSVQTFEDGDAVSY